MEREKQMKIHVEYDAEGNIKSIGIPISGGTKEAKVDPRQGHHVDVVDAPDGKYANDIEHLKDFARRFKIHDRRLVSR